MPLPQSALHGRGLGHVHGTAKNAFLGRCQSVWQVPDGEELEFLFFGFHGPVLENYSQCESTRSLRISHILQLGFSSSSVSF